jgi:hypothetical protein
MGGKCRKSMMDIDLRSVVEVKRHLADSWKDKTTTPNALMRQDAASIFDAHDNTLPMSASQEFWCSVHIFSLSVNSYFRPPQNRGGWGWGARGEGRMGEGEGFLEKAQGCQVRRTINSLHRCVLARNDFLRRAGRRGMSGFTSNCPTTARISVRD